MLGHYGSYKAADLVKELFVQILREGSAFSDVRDFREDGRSTWIHACSSLTSSELLNVLVQAGVNIAEVDGAGRNCLFLCVQFASFMERSVEFEALRYLLTVFDDIFARDNQGCTIFDLITDDRTDYHHTGSYRQDLWYCALYRSNIPLGINIPPPPRGPLSCCWYTKEHCRALLYLESWDFISLTCSEAEHPLINKDMLSKRDRETIPTLREWDPSKLSMMEERLGRARWV